MVNLKFHVVFALLCSLTLADRVTFGRQLLNVGQSQGAVGSSAEVRQLSSCLALPVCTRAPRTCTITALAARLGARAQAKREHGNVESEHVT